tara:strand:+ start:1251 stop:1421 length:171 start_codon:yes stop_codon:yes gene_type:complete
MIFFKPLISKKIKITTFKQVDQLYLIPTIKLTYSRTLNGNLEVMLCWLVGGISIEF